MIRKTVNEQYQEKKESESIFDWSENDKLANDYKIDKGLAFMDGKYTFWGMIIAAIITAGVTFYINYNDKRVEEKQEKERLEKIKAEKRSSIARVRIDEILLPSINTKLDSFFYLKISNYSYNDAKNLNLKINFGESEVTKCEIQPKPDINGSLNSSIYNYSLKELKKGDSFYIYCTLSNPIFDNILINGANLKDTMKLTFNDFKSKNKNKRIISKEELGFFEILFRIWFVIIGIYFTLVSITLMSRKLSL